MYIIDTILYLALLAGSIYLFTIMIKAEERKEIRRSEECKAAKEWDAKFEKMVNNIIDERNKNKE